ncbi:MAG: thioredoxin-disulfide reductase [Candidatus Zixiibacteriota bacterium]|nr:MAG: thioredoxin-disulfide reductase [candidate division Zixibacteria bacterium]
MQDWDIVIVGGGPGGLCAGLYGARANRKTVCIEKYLPGGEIQNTEFVEDYPGFEMISGPELARKFENHARKFGLEVVNDNILEIYSDGRYKIVKGDEDEYRAKAVIVATGGNPRKLGVPGEEELANKGVSYCALCDGAFFKGQEIAVVGGGDVAVEEGTFLTKFGSKVYIIHRRDKLRASKIVQERAFKNKKIEFVWDSVVEKINGSDKVESVTVKNVKTGGLKDISAGAIFPLIGFIPNSNIIRDEIEKDEIGYIITDQHMETSIKGIWAIGDVRKQLCKQITNAVGDGTTAAVAADKYIEAWDD